MPDQFAGVAADLVLSTRRSTRPVRAWGCRRSISASSCHVSGVPLNDSIVVWHSLSIGNAAPALNTADSAPKSRRRNASVAAAGPAARAPNGGSVPGSRGSRSCSAPTITDRRRPNRGPRPPIRSSVRCCASIRGRIARPSPSSSPAPLIVPDRSRTSTPVAGSGPTMRRPRDHRRRPPRRSSRRCSRPHRRRPAGTALQLMDATPLAIGDRAPGSGVGPRGQRIVVTTPAGLGQHDARIIKSRNSSAHAAVVHADSRRPARRRPAPVRDPRIVTADMGEQGRGVRSQQPDHIRIQRVIDEEALRAGGQQRNLDVEQGAVQAGDAVSLTGRPPSPQPMADGQPRAAGPPTPARCRRRRARCW